MKRKAPTACFLALLALSGCGGTSGEHVTPAAPPTLENPDMVAACLPTGVTLETKVTDKDGDGSETVKDVLARYQARIKDRKLYDISGRQIQFYKTALKGLAINNDKQYNELRKRYSVILLAGP
jgi:hypothetical protein